MPSLKNIKKEQKNNALASKKAPKKDESGKKFMNKMGTRCLRTKWNYLNNLQQRMRQEKKLIQQQRKQYEKKRLRQQQNIKYVQVEEEEQQDEEQNIQWQYEKEQDQIEKQQKMIDEQRQTIEEKQQKIDEEQRKIEKQHCRIIYTQQEIENQQRKLDEQQQKIEKQQRLIEEQQWKIVEQQQMIEKQQLEIEKQKQYLLVQQHQNVDNQQKTKKEKQCIRMLQLQVQDLSQKQMHPFDLHVRFKKLPFYELVETLVAPTLLVPEISQKIACCTIRFHLTVTQQRLLQSNRNCNIFIKAQQHSKLIQMRFCLSDITCEQEDCFPQNIMVKVNGKMCPLPKMCVFGVNQKQQAQPIDITPYVILTNQLNEVTIYWLDENEFHYVVNINLVQKLNASVLCEKLMQRNIKKPDETRAMIKTKLCEANYKLSSLKVSLICPLSATRIKIPCRASTCKHLQCFDAYFYLFINDILSSWMCPICHESANYENLEIDSYFQDILNSEKLPCNIQEVELHIDGTWTFVTFNSNVFSDKTPISKDEINKINNVNNHAMLPLLNISQDDFLDPENFTNLNTNNTVNKNNTSIPNSSKTCEGDCIMTSMNDSSLQIYNYPLETQFVDAQLLQYLCYPYQPEIQESCQQNQQQEKLSPEG